MLIRFRVSNFLSFNQEIELSMIPGRVRSHSHHIAKGQNRNDIDILRTAIIYGANASGKSNLIKAIDFACKLILKGTHANELIPRKAFKLSQETVDTPSKFEFEFKNKGFCYIYGFKIGIWEDKMEYSRS